MCFSLSSSISTLLILQVSASMLHPGRGLLYSRSGLSDLFSCWSLSSLHLLQLIIMYSVSSLMSGNEITRDLNLLLYIFLHLTCFYNEYLHFYSFLNVVFNHYFQKEKKKKTVVFLLSIALCSSREASLSNYPSPPRLLPYTNSYCNSIVFHAIILTRASSNNITSTCAESCRGWGDA